MKKLTNLLKESKASETILKIDYKKFRPKFSSKTHKKVFSKCAPVGPILSTIKTLSYSLERFLVLLTEPIKK